MITNSILSAEKQLSVTAAVASPSSYSTAAPAPAAATQKTSSSATNDKEGSKEAKPKKEGGADDEGGDEEEGSNDEEKTNDSHAISSRVKKKLSKRRGAFKPRNVNKSTQSKQVAKQMAGDWWWCIEMNRGGNKHTTLELHSKWNKSKQEAGSQADGERVVICSRNVCNCVLSEERIL